MEYREIYGYKVYADGTIVGKHGKQVKPVRTCKDYLLVGIKRDGRRTSISVHRLVALAFIGPCPDGYEVDHINNVRDDNRVENLQYLTRRDNRIKSYRQGNRRVEGEKNANAKFSHLVPIACAKLEEHFLAGVVPNVSAIARELGIPRVTLQKIWAGNAWTCVSKDYSFSSRFND